MTSTGGLVETLSRLPAQPGLTFRGTAGQPPTTALQVSAVLPTSQDPRVASENFTAERLAAIITRTGRLIAPLSAHPSEQEIALLPGILLLPIGTLAVPGLAAEVVILEEAADAPVDRTSAEPTEDGLPTSRDELFAQITATVTTALAAEPVQIHSPGRFTPLASR